MGLQQREEGGRREGWRACKETFSSSFSVSWDEEKEEEAEYVATDTKLLLQGTGKEREKELKKGKASFLLLLLFLLPNTFVEGCSLSLLLSFLASATATLSFSSLSGGA